MFDGVSYTESIRFVWPLKCIKFLYFVSSRVARRMSRAIKTVQEPNLLGRHTYTRDVLWFFIVPKGLGWWKKNKSNMIWWYTIKLNAGQPKKQGGRAELCDQLYRKVFMAPMWPTHQTTQQFGWQCWCQFTFNFTAAILFRPSFIPLLSPLSCALELLL